MEGVTEYRVSEKDRDYFRRLGKWKADVNAEELAKHLALPSRERILRSEQLNRKTLAWANQSGPEEEPRCLYERARRLGLYRS